MRAFSRKAGEAVAAAKHGRFRIGDSGRMPLTGRADADPRPLP
jgi:hypothetical protein